MKSVTFYAYLDREDGSSHGACLPSPVFRTEPELVSWIRAHREEGDEIHALRREVSGPVVNDWPLNAREDIPTDRARLRVLVQDLKSMLDAKNRELNRAPVKADSRRAS